MEEREIYFRNFSDAGFIAIREILQDISKQHKMVFKIWNDDLSIYQKTAGFVYNIESDNDYKKFLKVYTNLNNNFIACCLPIDSRDIIFQVSRLKNTDFFFHPFIKPEIEKIFSALADKIEKHENRSALFSAVGKMKHHCIWATKDIKISDTAKNLVSMIMNFNIVNDFDEEHHMLLSLEEALVNSIEHGNLELDSSLKKESINGIDKYEKLKHERLTKPEYAERKILINLSAFKNFIKIVIEDQGKGFNHSALIRGKKHRKINHEQVIEVHGKGLKLIERAFDSVKYNKKGNKIILIKKRNK